MLLNGAGRRLSSSKDHLSLWAPAFAGATGGERRAKNGRDCSRPFSFADDLSHRRGGAVPGGGGGSDACPPLSSGVMLRMVTRRLIALGPSVCSFRYCSP